MADLLQSALRGVPLLMPRRKVKYQRGAHFTYIYVTVGSTTVSVDDEYGVRQRAETRDYLIRRQDLIINGSAVEPAEGDEIVDANESLTRTYRCMATDLAEAWRYTDRYHTMYRVHTKEVDNS